MSIGAHPRSRGENEGERGAGGHGHGSSPLTRGKHERPERGRDARRLIPAHAGKTRSPKPRAARSRAHPRSRGENREAGDKHIGPAGSSPLTRGKPGENGKYCRTSRLIPAHAGKTTRSWITVVDEGAHPRSRGENGTRPGHSRDARGSSPLTRGKRSAATSADSTPGLIPAHAGKTCGRTGARTHARAHPRSRGENRSFAIRSAPRPGSSPLTRGKRHHQCRVGSPRGLIPAHAGKTHQPRARNSRPRAHPRSRGENVREGELGREGTGSSPLTRGKLPRVRATWRARGLIPAHAGKTPTRADGERC